jgi:hypothetical protein
VPFDRTTQHPAEIDRHGGVDFGGVPRRRGESLRTRRRTEVRYMLWMAGDGAEEPGPDEIRAMPDFIAWETDLAARGIPHRGARLRPPADAVTVRVRGGRVLVTDGPFADTKEHIGGFEIIEVADLDEAIDVAAKHPTSTRGAVEIRPFPEDES